MKKIILSLLLLISLFIPKKVEAKVLIAADSAQMTDIKDLEADNRANILQKYLEKYDSPLAEHAKKIVDIADKYQVPWTWVPAISGVESTFCQHIPYESYNCYGWNNGDYQFKDYDDGIEVVTKTLKANYINRGADTIEKIAPIYAPPSTTWAAKVSYFSSKIEQFAENDISQLHINL